MLFRSNSSPFIYELSASSLNLTPNQTCHYSYSVAITNPINSFAGFSTLADNGAFKSLLADPLQLNVNNGEFLTIIPPYKEALTFIGSINPNNITANGFSDVITQTPGPLSFFGACVAFGFSRKLRSRIKLNQ